MRALWSRMAPRDWLIVIGGLAVVAGIEMAKPVAPPPEPAAPVPILRVPGPPAMYPEPSRRVVRDIAGMRAEDRAQMDQAMADAPYFAAHAVGEDGAYGWSRGFATQGAARAAALETCAHYGKGCKVVAEVLPQGVEFGPDNSLSWDQSQAFLRMAKGLGPRAFARSIDGTWGTGTGETGQAAAALAAANCESAREVQPDLAPMPCEVIAVWNDGLLPPP